MKGEAVKPLSITILKGAGATVAAPTLAYKTNNSITINAVFEPANGQTAEYARATANAAPESGWQTNLTFTDLNANTTYYIFARAAVNENYFAGEASPSLEVTTNQAQITSSGESLTANPLKARVQNGTLHVTGITAGETLSVYTVTGALVYQSVVIGDETDIPLKTQGMYIVRSENYAIKVVY